ncbi:MAG: gamma-glutamyl-gamma-aminobutyrate hydrolase family protein [Pseudomonadota bacterium]
MRLASLETGVAPEPLASAYGRYTAMFGRLLSGVEPKLKVDAYPVFENAAHPTLKDFDALLITGSPLAVYEDHDWIAASEELIRETAAASKPIVGICFGHQLMAQAFGGRVAKSTRGWGVGVHSYDVVAAKPWMGDQPPEKIRCAVSHQDQVVKAPPGAQIVAGSDFCPNGALEYAQGRSLSFQMHPEFEHTFAADLLAVRRDRIPEQIAAPAFKSLEGDSDRALLARWIMNFIKA